MNADQSYLPYKMRYMVGAVKWCKRLLESRSCVMPFLPQKSGPRCYRIGQFRVEKVKSRWRVVGGHRRDFSTLGTAMAWCVEHSEVGPAEWPPDAHNEDRYSNRRPGTPLSHNDDNSTKT